MQPSVLFSILIPVCNDADNLRVCLKGLEAQDLHDCEILVCDDGSVPPLRGTDVCPPGLPVQLVYQVNRGPATARNRLARMARGEYLFFIDADTVAAPDMVGVARNIVAANPRIPAFFGSYDNEPRHRTLISLYKNLLHHHTHHESSGERVSTFWCGCGVIRRDLFSEAGGLSEFYDKPSIEDIELGTRLTKEGVPIQVFSELQVKHLKRWTLYSWLATDLLRRGIPWVRLMRSSGRWDNQLNFSWSQRIGTLAALLFFVCAMLAVFEPLLLVPALVSLLVFVLINHAFFGLMTRHCGRLMGCGAIGLHLIYAVVCVISIIAGILPTTKGPVSRPTSTIRGRSASRD